MHFATDFWLTRLCFQHALGGIYLIAFLIAANQFVPLLGTRGLQPVRLFVRHVPFRRAPSLFYINCSDQFITAMIWSGVGLSIFTISGFSESFGFGVSILTWAVFASRIRRTLANSTSAAMSLSRQKNRNPSCVI